MDVLKAVLAGIVLEIIKEVAKLLNPPKDK